MHIVWLRVAAVLYAVASATVLPAVLYGRPAWRRVCVPAAIGGFFFHFVSIVEMLAEGHHWVPAGTHEVESLLSLLVCGLFLLIALAYRTISFGIFALPLSLLLILHPALALEHGSLQSQTVRGGWLFLHISAMLTAYAALFFSVLASLFYLVQERRLKNKKKADFLTWLPPLETMNRIAGTTLLIGFPFMTLGLLAGSLIAQESVGAVYFADPKILLSFAMWLLYLLLLFVRQSKGLRGLRAVYLSTLVVLVVLSVWAANTFSSVHRFSAP